MDTLTRISFVLVFSLIADQACCRSSLDPFPLGTIGCLVADVCDQGEICTNDFLFGTCQTLFSRAFEGEIQFKLSSSQIEYLGEVIGRLVESGFTWRDAFTQCALQNTLVEFAHGRAFDRFACEDALGAASTQASEQAKEDEVASLLLQLLGTNEDDIDPRETYAESSRSDYLEDPVSSDKRDEIVQLHKYFDKSSQLKRMFPYDQVIRSSGYPSDQQNLSPFSLHYSSPQNIDETDKEASNVEHLYIQPVTNELVDQQPQFLVNDEASNEDNQEQLYSSEQQDSPIVDVPGDTISDEDEQILEGLLAGTLLPSDLDRDQQHRLKDYIDRLIQALDSSPDDENLQKLENMPPGNNIDDVSVVEPGTDQSMSRPYRLETDDTLDNTYDDQDKMYDTTMDTSDDNIGTEEVGPLAAPIVGGRPDKKMDIDEDEDEEKVQEDKEPHKSVDKHAMFMQLNKPVKDTEDAMALVENITEILKLPPKLLFFIEVPPGHMVAVEVGDDPTGKWNAETIAEAVQNHNDEIFQRSGYRVKRAGVGRDGNGVEVKQNKRYMVLAFVLVGCIAGVVLAAMIIYLVKQHSRSKYKLAQLANNPDGTEASKDYQDLCRQRMQGKTSEKPEPLHAAGRIGSVSEAQVRSPSSRSSTSSWSEEPAATNMDISTGHIVLAYMEDHLKNQDRLDKEWEAVSGYVADPSCTKVATDQSNIRKNRFADILPYDHSRVVLSSNANVANSDYINASFITDHDPRNPAYITTQGPLPHTIADFWQMIWEQGSVVIVMLTKLTENGTALCHRYWPDQGSDLYHIYEVHLVSEHIWCDDYLVRSFYLKNLQTNETRTVTQFHFLTWPSLSVPASIKALLDFRRKVNKSFRGRSCPIVVHCSDGCGRSGTYCLIDMVLNKMAKGAKEIDMAATLEHIRDQRMSVVETKEQFQFSLAAVAEEVHAILKALPQ